MARSKTECTLLTHQNLIKRRPEMIVFLVAGSGFEPLTSGL